MENNLFFREFFTNPVSWKDSGGKLGSSGALNRSSEKLGRYHCCPSCHDSLDPLQEITSLQELLYNIKYMLHPLLHF